MIKPSTTRVLSGLLALGVASAALDGVVLAPSALARTTSAVELRLRRSPGRLDVVIAGVGTEVRAVSQNQSNGRWSARLTGVDLGDRPFTPQQMVLPSSELLSVRLEPLDGDLQLIVKARLGERVPKPTIGTNGKSLVVSFAGLTGPDVRSSGRLDLRRPGRVAQPVMAPPMRPRAVAPPLGDMAVGTMLVNNRSFVQASGPPVSLTLNNAPAKDALMSLARLGGYGFVFVGGAGLSSSAGDDSSQYPVTMAFRNERYDRALNSVLMSSGLQGRLDGNTLLVGTAVSAKGFGPQMSKVFRLNQVDVASASQYLGNLGAEIAVASTSTVTSTEGVGGSGSGGSSVTTAATISDVETYTSGLGPLLGLVGTTDSRLNTITLIGDPKLISVAEGYLRQIDLRQRQVAVKVQILYIGLKNDFDIDSSFSARIGNTFLVSDSGRAYMNFGDYKPGSPFGTGVYDGVGYSRPGDYLPGINEAAEQLEDLMGDEFDQRDVSLRYPDSSFYSYLESAIVSSSAKVIAQPMVLVLEGEKARVEAATEVATAITTVTSGDNGSDISYETKKSNAGLTLDVELSKVDDNGFVNLSLTPEISVPLPGGFSQGVPLFNIKKRRVESGNIRLRDRQTLILTGIIQEDDLIEAQRWPILGDLPLIGSLFRSSKRTREKRELVVLVTPSVIDDEEGGIYGYGYSPRTSEARDLIQPGS